MPYSDTEQYRAYQFAYREAHRDESRAYQQHYRREHAEHLRVYDREHHARSMAADPEGMRVKSRAAWLRRNYGISVEDYDALLVAHDYRCAICGCEGDRTKPAPLNVDHDHFTGRIRGLLCNPCNRAIGLLKDDPAVIDRAAAYLKREVKP